MMAANPLKRRGSLTDDASRGHHKQREAFGLGTELSHHANLNDISIPSDPIAPPFATQSQKTLVRQGPNPSINKYNSYRVRGNFNRDNLCEKLWRFLGNDCKAQIQTFAVEPGENQGDYHEKIATVSFKEIPQKLLDGSNEWTCVENDITIDTHFKGLTTLYCPEPRNHKIDIISVCGLGGHALGSFKERGGSHVWLRDALPRNFPEARIMTYGYDSHVYRNTSNAGLEPFASSLRLCVEGLHDRDERSVKPIIFIVHSLGGLVLKEALIQSNENRSSLSQATSGALFFGVPNLGMEIKALVAMAKNQPNLALLYSLQADSELLQRQNSEFRTYLQSKHLEIFCFYENMESPTAIQENGHWRISGPKALLVSRASATGCLLSGADPAKRQGLDQTHSELVKLRQRDETYHIVRQVLRKMIPYHADENTTAEQRQRYLEALSFPLMDSRLGNVVNAHANTCNWIFDRLEYIDWLNPAKYTEHNGFLWIKGKPGAGKSTMMKHALNKAVSSMPKSKIISFFFSARGGELERSTEGMYRSLLFQILTQFQSLQYHIIPSTFEERPQWNVPDLQKALRSCIQSLEDHLIIFIDALDECNEDEARKMVEFLEEVAKIAVSGDSRLNICLSSRHYPHITIDKGLQLVMEDQDGHSNDILKYVNSKLGAGNSKEIVRVKREILERASGVFLWVVLVIPLLKKAYDHGQKRALQQRLKEIPNGLDNLFTDILTRDCENQQQLVLSLQWLLYSQRPLRRDELYYAIISGDDPEFLPECDPTEISAEVMDRFILSCSKGLFEIGRTKHRIVQFIHESVRDFFLRHNGFSRIQLNLTGDLAGPSHERLAQCCYNYITADMYHGLPTGDALPRASTPEAKNLRLEVAKQFPFLDYAINNIFYHSNQAEALGMSQRLFVDKFIQGPRSVLSTWVNLSNILEHYTIRQYSSSVNLTYIFAQHDLSNIMPITIDSPLDYVSTGNERYSSPFYAAIASVSGKALRTIIQACKSFHLKSDQDQSSQAEESFDLGIRALLESKASDQSALLKYVNRTEQPFTLELAIAVGAVDPSLTHQDGTPLLGWAASMGHEAVVRLLLATDGVDPDAKDRHGQSPLWRAAEMGHEAVVRLLIAADVDPDAKDDHGQSPLWRAAEMGHEAVVRLLIAADVDPDAKDDHGQSPLWRAAAMGNEAVVRLLLATDGVDPDAKDRHGQSPLSWAASMGHEAVVRLLLATDGVDPDAKDGHGQSPLWRAAAGGHEAVVKLFKNT